MTAYRVNDPLAPKKGEQVRDYRGNPLNPTSRVAFNLSGNVVLGEVVVAEIVEVVKDQYNYWMYPRYKIRVALLEPAHGHPAGHVSEIKNADSLVRV